MEIVANCFGSLERDFRIWAWYCRHFDQRRIVDRAYFYASCEKCGEIRSAITASVRPCAMPCPKSIYLEKYHNNVSRFPFFQGSLP